MSEFVTCDYGKCSQKITAVNFNQPLFKKIIYFLYKILKSTFTFSRFCFIITISLIEFDNIDRCPLNIVFVQIFALTAYIILGIITVRERLE